MATETILLIAGITFLVLGGFLAVYVWLIRLIVFVMATAGQASWNPLAWLLPLIPIASGVYLIYRSFH